MVEGRVLSMTQCVVAEENSSGGGVGRKALSRGPGRRAERGRRPARGLDPITLPRTGTMVLSDADLSGGRAFF